MCGLSIDVDRHYQFFRDNYFRTSRQRPATKYRMRVVGNSSALFEINRVKPDFHQTKLIFGRMTHPYER